MQKHRKRPNAAIKKRQTRSAKAAELANLKHQLDHNLIGRTPRRRPR
ncbi:hypothetical protein ACFQ41_05415 [Lacticaseibacillus suilingensis]|uniref:Uncharacterized protein n=1 Tax=Lacticaseibacillus suilingensis TaxID=2799577 RepID=A0ABW4BG11_9LACO|nr:hypothetical protein [Lacticaseibacillus suilingensis]MCI1893393.1 hypothetical protein [Lactobacillus sp.]MCI2016264.1 hypothetical protein [Lactobacillus sp.]